MDNRRPFRYHLSDLLPCPSIPALGAVAAAAWMAAVLVGCSVSRTFDPDTYTVKNGDTLSEIAQRYHINWHNLARWNHIRAPYRLDVGQKLTLNPYPPLNYAGMPGGGPNAAAASGRPRSSQDNGASGGATRPLPQHGEPTVSRRPASPAARASRTSNAPGKPPSSGHKEAEENAIAAASSSRAAKQTTVKAGGPSADGWQWPASGSVLRAYDPSARRRGIEIGGTIGGPVYAASSGTVVYNGTGLKGYGKLIIIKHGPHYLSAYGFNKKSLVKQGQTIAAGAHIADIGHGPGNKPMLHFEIRHDGEPINPQKVLPKR